MSEPCRVVRSKDGTVVRVQGSIDADTLQSLVDKVRAREATRCHALSDKPMPGVAQRIHGRETYWCGRERGHSGPHRWPEHGQTEWPTEAVGDDHA